MNVEEAATRFSPVSLKALKRLVDDGLISVPLSGMDQYALSILSQIWTSEWYVAQMNKTFKPDKRALMLAFPDFGKIERYILNSYLPDKFKKKTRVSVREVAERIRDYFHIEYPEFKIKRIRQIAYNMLRSSRGESRKRFLALADLELKSPRCPDKSVKNSK
jgi:hypothetical protein